MTWSTSRKVGLFLLSHPWKCAENCNNGHFIMNKNVLNASFLKASNDTFKSELNDLNQLFRFLRMDGYNIFGKSKYFAPRVRWSILEKRVDKVKEAAEE